MSRDIAPFGLRMPAEMKAEIEAAAASNGRSMNAEIVARLERSLGSRRGNASQVLAKIIEILPKWEKAVLEIGEEIELFGQGEKGALNWLKRASPSLDDGALIKAGNAIESNIKRDIEHIRSQIPAIIQAAQEGGDAPASVVSLLRLD